MPSPAVAGLVVVHELTRFDSPALVCGRMEVEFLRTRQKRHDRFDVLQQIKLGDIGGKTPAGKAPAFLLERYGRNSPARPPGELARRINNMHFKWMIAAVLFPAAHVFAAVPFHCGDRIPLQVAIDFAVPNETLLLTGTCSGPIVINRKSITLESNTGAVIDGTGKDAITVTGPVRLSLKGITVQHGNNGINATSGAQLILTNMQILGNKAMGVLLTGASSVTLSGVATNGNGVNGLDAEGSSSIVVKGAYQSNNNGVFGLNINGSSSFTLSQSQVSVSGNTLGIQIGTSASAFISDAATSITASNNAATGLTIVSGAHMVDFGGTITATGNGVHGVSVDSKAGLDLDAAGTLNSSGNTQDGVHLEETSVLTMFNTPAFSGAPGTTTINTYGNGGNGLNVLTGSNFTVIHQAALDSTNNMMNGVQVDNGSSITLIQSTVTGNTAADVALTFGSRGDITSSTIGKLTCDATVIVRGSYTHCPI